MDQTDNLFGRGRAKRKIRKQLIGVGKTKRQARKFARKATKGMVKSGIKRTLGTVAVAPLLPFKPVIKKILSKRGIAIKNMKFPQLVEKFYNVVIAKSKDNPHSSLEECPVGLFYDNYTFTTPIPKGTTELPDHVVGDIVGSIVQAVINHFKKRKKEKQALENQNIDPLTQMTSEDIEMANATDKVLKDLEQKELEDKNVKAGQLKKILFIVLGVGLVVIVGYMFMKKK